MPDPRDPDFLNQQQELFTRITRRYDLVNHIMTGWQDNRWRRFAIKQLQLPPAAQLLDIGSGNGQLAQEALRLHPDCRPVAADLTQSMLEVGRLKDKKDRILWTRSNSAHLPFDNFSFDGVISGFLLRNLSDIFKGLREQYRVLKPGGRIAVLDTSKTPQNLLSPLIRFYMKKMMPALGGFISGHKQAYKYLNRSTEEFLRVEELAAYLAAAGFKEVAYKQFALGIIAVHWGRK
ncbi:MAG: ubiquinone/menaquinone biosynthesis methyltransferase [Anaerolineales bacterium]